MNPRGLTRRIRLGSTFKIAARALRRNKLRSALTALGINIGVGAVIARVGIRNAGTTPSRAEKALRPHQSDQHDSSSKPRTSSMKRALCGGTTLSSINARVARRHDLAPAQQQIVALLRQGQNIREGRGYDLTGRTQ